MFLLWLRLRAALSGLHRLQQPHRCCGVILLRQVQRCLPAPVRRGPIGSGRRQQQPQRAFVVVVRGPVQRRAALDVGQRRVGTPTSLRRVRGDAAYWHQLFCCF